MPSARPRKLGHRAGTVAAQLTVVVSAASLLSVIGSNTEPVVETVAFWVPVSEAVVSTSNDARPLTASEPATLQVTFVPASVQPDEAESNVTPEGRAKVTFTPVSALLLSPSSSPGAPDQCDGGSRSLLLARGSA